MMTLGFKGLSLNSTSFDLVWIYCTTNPQQIK